MPQTNLDMPSDASIITTYRCQMRCKMCDIWNNPTDSSKEITAQDLEILPKLGFVNVTGGEPFVRRDLDQIIEVLYTKSNRIVISTSGYHYQRIIRLAERFPNIGIRVSLEGLSQNNDELRGREGGFDRGIKTLLALKEMGVKDIGFGMTVSDRNAEDLLWLYKLSKSMGMEFATAAFHNSFYFHKTDNLIEDRGVVVDKLSELTQELLKENKPKAWFRAFFNLGLINYVRGGKRMLPCEAGSTNFFVEPYGDVYPCNGLEEKYWKDSMGNIKNISSFDEIWFSTKAKKVRGQVATCPKNCWMVGTAAPVMRRYVKYPLSWVLINKYRSIVGKSARIDNIPYYDVGQNPLQGNLRQPVKKVEAAKTRYPIYKLAEEELKDMLSDEER